MGEGGLNSGVQDTVGSYVHCGGNESIDFHLKTWRRGGEGLGLKFVRKNSVYMVDTTLWHLVFQDITVLCKVDLVMKKLGLEIVHGGFLPLKRPVLSEKDCWWTQFFPPRFTPVRATPAYPLMLFLFPPIAIGTVSIIGGRLLSFPCLFCRTMG